MDRANAEGEYYFSKEFFETIVSMQDNIMFFHVVYEGKIISTELVIYGAKNCYSYLGGTDRDYFDQRPNDFLKYEVIKWAKEKGLKNFVLGGGYGSDDGIFQYKLCWHLMESLTSILKKNI
jgi:lipid II:glycine glycyltransferase (peptidoglycan interpeptide bridge formation enzyme)